MSTALAARHLTDDDLRQARGLNRRLVESLDAFDPHLFTAVNHRFHAVRFAAGPNPRLRALVDAEWTRLGHLRDSTCSCDTEQVKPECGCSRPPRFAVEKLMK